MKIETLYLTIIIININKKRISGIPLLFLGSFPCMICKSFDGKRLKCNIDNCGKWFHEDCLTNGLWSQTKITSNQLTCPGDRTITQQGVNFIKLKSWVKTIHALR